MGSTGRLLLLVALCVVGGFFAGRAYWSLRQSPPPPPLPTAPAAPATAVEVPDVRLPDLSGTTRSLHEWTSDSLVLNFWATWCAPCRREMPLLEQLHQERGGRGPAVVGVAIDREDPVRRFVAETGVTYPILFGETEAMAAAESFGPEFVGLPLTVIAAPGGRVLKMHMGEIDLDDIRLITSVLDRLKNGELDAAAATAALAPLDAPAPGTGN